MKLITMLSDILHSLFSRPVTQRYPFERHEAPERYRGKLHWHPEKCTGCCLCHKECPANALELITLDQKNKQFVMRYHADRCVYCAQCVQNCRFDCLEMSPQEWEMAAQNKELFTIYYGEEHHINELLGKLTQPPVANVEAEKTG